MSGDELEEIVEAVMGVVAFCVFVWAMYRIASFFGAA